MSIRRTHNELLKRFVWNDGGYGFGVCAIGNSLIWGSDRPGPDKPDLPSTVFLCGNPAKYTDEELAKLTEFADEQDRRYDEMFHWRRGCNAILFDKVEAGRWMRKRLTWQYGPMFSTTLDEAIAVFTKEWKRMDESRAYFKAQPTQA